MAVPFCDGCRRRRRVMFAVAFATMGAGVALAAIDIVRTDGTSFAAIGPPIVLVGYVLLHWARLQVIARMRLTGDGSEITVRRPAAEFEAQVKAAVDAATEAVRGQSAHQTARDTVTVPATLTTASAGAWVSPA